MPIIFHRQVFFCRGGQTHMAPNVAIGIQDTSGNMLITLNNYAEFENIMLDKPEGM